MRLLIALVALYLASASAVAGQAPSASRVGGIVRQGEGGLPLEGADVVLAADPPRGDPPSLRTRTTAEGRFEFASVAPGRYKLTVRRLGFAAAGQSIRIPADSGTRLDVTLSRVDFEAAYATERRRQFEAALAKARARPRHWRCERRAAEVARYARRWLWLAGASRRNQVDGQRDEWGIPADSARFLREFQPIRSAADCARVARNVDATYGLEQDYLIAFRIGRIYLLPTLGGLGAVADLEGRVTSVFVMQ